MTKRARPRTKIVNFLRDESRDLEFRPFKKLFSGAEFHSIWIKENEDFEQQPGFIYCKNSDCKHKKTIDKV